MLILPKNTCIFIYICLNLLFCLPLHAQDNEPNLPISPNPDWVDELNWSKIDEIPANDVEGGSYNITYEEQINVSANLPTQYYYAHLVALTNLEGVEQSSQLSINFNPEYEKLNIHRLAIIRDGKLLNQLKNVRYKVLQREEDLDQLIYNGELTANIIFSDVRVGDMLFYSYSLTGDNPILGGLFSYSATIAWGVPVGKQKTRILWNKNSPLDTRKLGTTVNPQNRNTRYGREYLIELSNIAAIYKDDDTPSWYDYYPKIVFSETHQWRDVVNWALPLYAPAYGKSLQAQRIASEIAKITQNPSEQISLALQRAQSDIRYLGIEIGTNSHNPSNPSETWERRWGDCKDKTVALIAVLHQLGLKAYPALVNTYKKHRIADYGPSVNAFNHVIVALDYDNKLFWLDPTRSYQTGKFPDIFQPHYGKALLLKKGENALQDMNHNQPIVDQSSMETFTITADKSIPVKFDITTIYRGRDAEASRENYASSSLKKTQKRYLDYYEYYYPETSKTQLIEIDDNTAVNIINVQEHYQSSKFWSESDNKQYHEGTFYFGSFYSYLKKPDTSQRKAPLHWTHPVKLSSQINIHFESDNWEFDNESETVDNEFFKLNFSSKYNEAENRLTLTNTLTTKLDTIPADKISAYIAEREKALDLLSYTIQTPILTGKVEPETSTYDKELVVVFSVLGISIAGLVAAIIMWIIEEYKSVTPQGQRYWPVSSLKFFYLTFITLGLYHIYWFYKNWAYLKVESLIHQKPKLILDAKNSEPDDNITDSIHADSNHSGISEYRHIMPFWRAIFGVLWLIPLGNGILKTPTKIRLPLPLSKPLIIAVGIGYIVMEFISQRYEFWWLVAAQTLLLVPLIAHISKLNQENAPTTYTANSKFKFRYLLALPFSLLLYFFIISDNFHLLPPDEIVDGNSIPSFHLRYLQRKNIVPPNESIQRFYSSAFWDWKEDGNGFTENTVFSYWKEDGVFDFRSVSFTDITNIETEFSTENLVDSIITIHVNDDSYFLLFVSNEKNEDRKFVERLMNNWRIQKPESQNQEATEVKQQ